MSRVCAQRKQDSLFVNCVFFGGILLCVRITCANNNIKADFIFPSVANSYTFNIIQ